MNKENLKVFCVVMSCSRKTSQGDVLWRCLCHSQVDGLQWIISISILLDLDFKCIDKGIDYLLHLVRFMVTEFVG